jgi:dienelactone hydrolase
MRIEVSPRDALYDEPVQIRLTGFQPLGAVSVTAWAADGLGRRWSSQASFVADANGELDLAREAPRSGSYRNTDAHGLLWSMQLDAGVIERTPFLAIRPDEVTIHFEAEADSRRAATDIVRRFMTRDIVREEVRVEGLVGTFFHSTDGARPGVIMVSGSGGGVAEDQPALLASRGYSVLSLGYFLTPGLPQDLIEIPLEYFERAIAWMKHNPAVQSEKIAVSGISRGGELSLLLGATFPEIKAVIAYVPSGIVWPGIGASGESAKSAWTWRGEPVTCMKAAPPNPELWSRNPVPMTSWFEDSIKNQEAVERAAIAVEKINGPVLMFSGTDDQMWPSLKLADLAVQRFIAKDFQHPYEHVSYAGAGHFIRFPYSPVITEIFHPITKTMMALGGNAEANHIANLDSWRRMLSFLKKFLG